MSQPITHVWVVYDPCNCDNVDCHGIDSMSVFTSEQTARQEADVRSKRYGGYDGYPHLHIDKVRISTKISRF